MKKQLEIQKKLVLSYSLFESLDLLRQFIHHLSPHPFMNASFVELWPSQCGHSSIHHPPFWILQFLLSIYLSLDSPVVWSAPLYSQLALLVSVTGIGGNFSGTGAEGGSQSLEAAPDPAPGGPHADTGPSEEEARDPSRWCTSWIFHNVPTRRWRWDTASCLSVL